MKILASDYDGTLYFGDKGYREEDIDAIEKFRADGNLFGVCTGRPLRGITEFMHERIKLDFYILNSGTLILDRNRECLFKKTIDHQVCKYIMGEYSMHDITIFTNDHIYFTDEKEAHDFDFFVPIKEIVLEENVEVFGVSLHLENTEAASQLIDAINQIEGISAYQNKESIDCVAQGCSKDTGAKFIRNYFGISNDVACIGDSFNDLPMLEGTSLSFTFNDSPDQIKDKSNYVVDSINECISILMENK